MKRTLLIALPLLLTQPIYSDIVTGSSISTANGNTKVESLRLNQRVHSLSKDKRQLTTAQVKSLSLVKTNKIIEITIDGKIIKAHENQTFYNPSVGKWMKAKHLSAGGVLLGQDMKHKPIIKVNPKTGKFEVVRVYVDGTHYVFSDGVLTHNFLGIALKVAAWIGWTVVAALIDKGTNSVADKVSGSDNDEKGGDTHNHNYHDNSTHNYDSNHPSNTSSNHDNYNSGRHQWSTGGAA